MDQAHQELREFFRQRVSQSLSRARICLQYARTVRSDDAHQPKNKPTGEELMEKTLKESWGRTTWSSLGRHIRVTFRQRPILSVLAVGLAVLVIAKIAIAHGPGTSGHVGRSGCANQQPGEIDPRGMPCLTTPVPPPTAMPATILKLHCGEEGVIRRCEDED
jgi:hypothetical protein